MNAGKEHSAPEKKKRNGNIGGVGYVYNRR